MVEIVADPFPEDSALNGLLEAAWGGPPTVAMGPVLERSLAHVGAYEGERLVGFVNVAWDGGIHAFILDTCVEPTFRKQGIATRMIAMATDLARERGAKWLHVDFEPHLTGFYAGCGFRPTAAGLIRLE